MEAEKGAATLYPGDRGVATGGVCGGGGYLRGTLYLREGKRRKDPQTRTPGRGSGERSRNIVPQGGRRGERSPKVGREGQRRKDLKTEPVTRLKCMQTWIDRDSTLVVTSDDQKEFLGNLRCRQRTTTTVE